MLGRGITNSRSNYDAACQISLSEALINARFSRIDAELESAGVSKPDRDAFIATLDDNSVSSSISASSPLCEKS